MAREYKAKGDALAKEVLEGADPNPLAGGNLVDLAVNGTDGR
jgi:hypothetical protein